MAPTPGFESTETVFVEVRHDDILTTASVPEAALAHYESKGWQRTEPGAGRAEAVLGEPVTDFEQLTKVQLVELLGDSAPAGASKAELVDAVRALPPEEG